MLPREQTYLDSCRSPFKNGLSVFTQPIQLLLIFVFLLSIISCTHYQENKFIAVNQLGYETKHLKQAYLINSEAYRFKLVRTSDSKVVFSDSIKSSAERDSATGDKISVIDFSEYNSEGQYVIKVEEPEAIKSNMFKISQNMYADALKTMIKSYYYHRCGTQVSSSSDWGHEVCHTDDAVFFNNPKKSKNVTGGWHDAGDYNKFSVNTALSAGLLLYAYESNPDNFLDNQLNIPESDNGIPDLLDEVNWALDWLLKMQRNDGAVYHKVSRKKWTGAYLPHNDPNKRYIFNISSAATASFTAATAIGARLLKNHKVVYAQKLRDAAEHAWNWLEKNPNNVPKGGFKNPEGVLGGEYSDPSDLDERLWAAVELYKLTSNEKYLSFFIENYNSLYQKRIPPLSWRDAQSLALRSFLLTETNRRYLNEKKTVENALIQHANNILDVKKENNYNNLIRKNQYYWGSNSVGLAYAFDLISAYKITGQLNYINAAFDQFHFILGRNPLNRSQVTGIGSKAVQHPHHQLSEMDGVNAPIPGMLVGGPNNHLLLKNKKISTYPAKNYEDIFRNYLVNEPAINYTAILVNVTSALAAPTKSDSNNFNP